MTREEKRQYRKDEYYACKRLHICVNCYKQDAYTLNGHAYCFDCKEKHNARTREYRSSSVVKAKEKEYRSTLKKSREENHECVRCGKPLESGSTFKRCKRCRAKDTRQQAERRLAKGIIPRILFDGIDRCCICGKQQVADGHKLCSEHLNMQRKIISENRKYLNMENNYFAKLNNAFWNSFRNVRGGVNNE